MLLFLLTICCFVSSGVSFTYEDCGAEDAIVRFYDVNIQPSPLVFAEKAAVAAKVRIKDIVSGGVSNIEMFRLIRLFGVTIPVKIPCAWGTCSRELCRDLDFGTLPCQWLSNANVTCGCPLLPATIKSNDSQITLPSLNSFFSMFLGGNYRLRWTWMDTRDREIGCVTADIAIDSKKKQK